MTPTDIQNIILFKSLFRGREDVFATRWEKANKSGYMPAYFFDAYRFRAHKAKGGIFQNYPDKVFLQLTDEQLQKHLNGEQLIGLYPLLPNNTSWFIAADFDEDNWMDDCRLFLAACIERNITAYLERSRSGKGGHVWIFFEEAYPAVKSRKILLALLKELNIISAFDKNSSFDRLFPNQDFLSGKGFGNLIALPLHKPATEQGNSCFVDVFTMEPYQDQWLFLKSIQRISASNLDKLYDELGNNENSSPAIPTISSTLQLVLNSTIRLNRNAIPLSLINYLKEELNFANTAFFVKNKQVEIRLELNGISNLLKKQTNLLFYRKALLESFCGFAKNTILYMILLTTEREKPLYLILSMPHYESTNRLP